MVWSQGSRSGMRLMLRKLFCVKLKDLEQHWLSWEGMVILGFESSFLEALRGLC